MNPETSPQSQTLDCSEAANRLKEQIPAILEQWEALARTFIPAAREHDRPVLWNHLPEYLDKMVVALAQGELQDDGEDTLAAREHGGQRAELENYSLEQIIEEYFILRKVLLDVLAAEKPLSLEAEQIIHRGIDWAIRKAASQYVAVTEDALYERAAEMERADRMKNEFLATLAHELRSPLSAITSALYVLDKAPLDDRARRSHAIATRQTRQMVRMISELTEVTRIARGKIDLQCRAVNLNDFLREMEPGIRPTFEERNQAFSLVVPSETLTAHADPMRLEQVLSNLLKNASKYTEEGGQVRLHLEREENEAVFRVQDTGIGIEPTMIPHIFDLYAQADPSSSRSQRGLGIGLTLVKRLVELHGGSVSAHSEGLNRGSEFTVRLPLS